MKIEAVYNPLGIQPVVGIYAENGIDGTSHIYYFDEHDEAKEFCDWVNEPANKTHLATLFAEYQ